MLYVVLSNGVVRYWHIGQARSGHGSILDNISMVKEVQADGDELEWIKENISGIPFCKPEVKRSPSWFGDTAKFIANCLP